MCIASSRSRRSPCHYARHRATPGLIPRRLVAASALYGVEVCVPERGRGEFFPPSMVHRVVELAQQMSNPSRTWPPFSGRGWPDIDQAWGEYVQAQPQMAEHRPEIGRILPTWGRHLEIWRGQPTSSKIGLDSSGVGANSTEVWSNLAKQRETISVGAGRNSGEFAPEWAGSGRVLPRLARDRPIRGIVVESSKLFSILGDSGTLIDQHSVSRHDHRWMTAAPVERLCVVG